MRRKSTKLLPPLFSLDSTPCRCECRVTSNPVISFERWFIVPPLLHLTRLYYIFTGLYARAFWKVGSLEKYSPSSSFIERSSWKFLERSELPDQREIYRITDVDLARQWLLCMRICADYCFNEFNAFTAYGMHSSEYILLDYRCMTSIWTWIEKPEFILNICRRFYNILYRVNIFRQRTVL